MRSLFRYLVCILVPGCLLALSSCDRDCKNEYPFYYRYGLTFYVLDEDTGQNLLEVGVNRYNSETVEIYDQNLEPLGIHPDLDGSIYFGFLQHLRNHEEPINVPINHTYYIYFEEGDYDTLRIGYQIGIDECDDKVLTEGSVTYNDSLYIRYTSNPREDWGAFFIKKDSGK